MHNDNRRFKLGFWAGALMGLCLVGTTLYAITAFPFFSPTPPREAVPLALPSPTEIPVPILRPAVPQELSWFFMRYPTISPTAVIHPKTRHRYVVSDVAAQKEYVISLAQSSRRVEAYSRGGYEEVDIYKPGNKRAVTRMNGRTVSDKTEEDSNSWMWRTPLWNSMHLRIYAMGDMWRDSTFKKYSCAGFVHRFLGDVGVEVPPLDAWDMAKLPYQRIRADEIEPGDIITIRAASDRQRKRWGHNITHVGVYLGNGEIIHAATSSPQATRAYIRIGTISVFAGRINSILRPPELN